MRRARIPAVQTAKTVVLILGTDAFRIREAIENAIGAHPDLEVSRFTGDRTTTAQVLDDLRTPTFTGGRRVVVVEGAEPLLEEESLQALVRYAQTPVKGTLLVLQAKSLDKRRKGAKALAQAAHVEECIPFRFGQALPWIRSHAKEAHGLRLGGDAARVLQDLIGDERGLLDSALARLKQQVAPRKTLTTDDITESTDAHRSPPLFDAMNAVEAADLPGCLAALDACLDEGLRVNTDTVTDPVGVSLILLNKLHDSYVRCLRYLMLRKGGLAQADALKAVRVSPQAASYFLNRVRRHDLDRLAERHHHFVEADARLKSGDDKRHVLQSLVLCLLK